MNELRRIQFEKASIGKAVGIYNILDFFVFAQKCTELSRKCFMRASGNLPGIYLNSYFQFGFWFSTNCTMYTVYLLTCSSYSKQLLQNSWKMCNNALQNKSQFACIACSLKLSWCWFSSLSTDWKVRTILNSIINSTTGKYCSVALIWIISLRISFWWTQG